MRFFSNRPNCLEKTKGILFRNEGHPFRKRRRSFLKTMAAAGETDKRTTKKNDSV